MDGPKNFKSWNKIQLWNSTQIIISTIRKNDRQASIIKTLNRIKQHYTFYILELETLLIVLALKDCTISAKLALEALSIALQWLSTSNRILR